MTDEYDDRDLLDLSNKLSREHDKALRHSLQLDVDYYKDLLDAPDLGDAEKEQIITALWQIVVSFVELGFGVHPTQQACGKGGTKQDQTSISGEDGLEYRRPTTDRENIGAPEP